ncbi:MAG: hypothetical protein D6805_06300, partial [Planctomycetota bacterium]
SPLSPHPLTPSQLQRIQKELNKFQNILTFLPQLLPTEYKPQLISIQNKLAKCQNILKNPSPSLAKNLGYFQFVIYQNIQQALHQLSTLSRLRPIGPQQLPRSIQDQFISHSKRYFAVYAYPRKSVLNRENIEEVLKAMRNTTEKSTGLMIMVYHFIYIGLQDFPLVTAVVILTVLILLLIDFQSLGYTLLALLPIGFAAVIALGIVGATGLVVSVLTFVAFPLIFGIGIDDGVHVIHRFRETAQKNVAKAIAQTGKSIFFTSLTTMASFGVLILTEHHGFIGMGVLITLGIGLCFIASVSVLPAMLVIAQRWGWIQR